ncbi:hypothetical protein [Uliginosibacterium gangwonense]|uniref:hypothetical protein n=1 Tax=Uliginosibacterium gangwonense TaxID=392736 RepID=UPI00052495F8|nr:hypothetical protein [Uliginosibacterium gangwonense]
MLKLKENKRLWRVLAILYFASFAYRQGILGTAFILLILAGGAIMVPTANRLEKIFKPKIGNFSGVAAIMLTVAPAAFVGGYLGIKLIRAFS